MSIEYFFVEYVNIKWKKCTQAKFQNSLKMETITIMLNFCIEAKHQHTVLIFINENGQSMILEIHKNNIPNHFANF